jgi:predicted porin
MKRLTKHLFTTASVIGLCAAMIPASAFAETNAQLEAQITALQAELNQLKTQVAEKPAPAPVAMSMATPAPTGGITLLPGASAKPKFIKPVVGGAEPVVETPGGALFITGDIDAGVRLDSGAGHSILSVQSGLMRASRLTFEGYQDVPYFGLRVVGVAEGGWDIAQGIGAGNPGAASSLPKGSSVNDFTFGRDSFVGIGNDKYGYIDFGRQYAPIWAVSAAPVADPFAGNYLGGIVALDPTMAVNSRVSNSIAYDYRYTWEGMLDPSPPVGFGFAAMYAPGNASGRPGTPINSGLQYGASASYGTKKWWLGGGFQKLYGINLGDSQAPESATYVPAATTNKPILTEITLAGSYVTPYGRLMLEYNSQSNGRKHAGIGPAGVVDGVEQQDFMIGAVVPTIKGQLLKFSYGKLFDETSNRAQYSMEQASYEFDLTKAPGCAIYIEGLVVENSHHSAQGILGAANVGTVTAAGGTTSILPTQLTANGTTLDYGATASTIATGVRYIF